MLSACSEQNLASSLFNQSVFITRGLSTVLLMAEDYNPFHITFSLQISLLLSCLVSSDMYYTAKLFHQPQASVLLVRACKCAQKQ